MPDELPTPAQPTTSDAPAHGASGPTEPTAPAEPTAPTGDMPEYRGEPLDSERGPGLGCFWIQIGLLTFFLIFTPLTVTWGWPPIVSAALLIFTLILLLFSGQTIIFLLRLVAADRRTRRTPLDPKAKPTVGQMEEAAPAAGADGSAEASPEQAQTDQPGARDDD